MFPYSTKHEIRHFCVVVVQRRLRNALYDKARCTCKVVQRRLRNVHNEKVRCTCKVVAFFCRSHSPRRRRCASSLISDHNCAHKYVSSTSHTSNKEFTLVGETFSFLLLLCQAVAQYNYKKMNFYILRKNVNVSLLTVLTLKNCQNYLQKCGNKRVSWRNMLFIKIKLDAFPSIWFPSVPGSTVL